MTDKEVNLEIGADFEGILLSSTIDRYSSEYDKLRKKRKVNKDDTFPYSFRMRSKRKNDWLFVFNKAPSSPKYRGLEDISYASVIHYTSNFGLQAFKINPSGGLTMFYRHVFLRYADRMSLDINNTYQILERFFQVNGFAHYRVKDDNCTFGIVKEGYLLGELDRDLGRVVNRTFVPHQMAFADQFDERESMKESLLQAIKNLQGTPGSDDLAIMKDVFSNIDNFEDIG